MKKLYILFFLTIGFLGNAQIINFPDANFKAKLLNATPSNQTASRSTSLNGATGLPSTTYHYIDTNYNGEIEVSEAALITYLNISNSGISNLEGLEYFTNLVNLNCHYNSLTSLNVSQNGNLEFLTCSSNQLPTIDLTQNLNLGSLRCDNNQLATIDLSQNLNLWKLHCSYNLFTTLDINQNINLSILQCTNNQLTSIDVSQHVNLNELRISNNMLTSLDVSQNSILTKLYCNNNQLSTLDVTQNANLSVLDCNDNQLTILDVGNIWLDQLYCINNQLTTLDVSQSTGIRVLSCDNNQLTDLFMKVNRNNWNTLNFSDNPNLSYICADEFNFALVQQKIDQYGYTSTCHVNSYCSFTPGGTFYEISGNTKLDSNNNGCDILDINYSNLRFNITNGTVTGSTISNQTGNYYIPVQAGNHTITPNLENPSYFNISPTSFTVNFPTQTSPFMQDFCVTANGVKSDLEVVLLPTTPARPGFDATYKLFYRNKGNQVENGTVSLTFDDARLDYVSSNPVYYSSAVNNFTWNYTNLQPFETREIALVLNVNSPIETPAVNNGDVLNYTATITTSNTDETPLDNTFTLDQTVVGSYDPNDKTCLEGETIAPSEVGKYVHYVIRFENTGTYPAENIVVKDMIDLSKFDITTLVPLKSSHDFFTRISGNKVEFIFENINLDFNDSTNDGYVVFKIKTLPSLVLGDTFTNNANIYFDYNFPITTNTYTTTVAALSTQDFDFGTYFTLYPNPTKDILNIQTKQDVVINSVEIYNQLGQIVMATTNVVNSVDVANLASGAYFVKVNTEKGSANAKFVKE